MNVPLPADQPVIFPELGVQVHEKLVPATPDNRVILVSVLLHICNDIGLLATLGIGFTVATKSEFGPVQPLALGVTW